MIIEKLVVGLLETNCYILADEKTKDAVIIDPGDEHKKIRAKVEKLGLIPLCVIITHGHGDHIGANKDLGLPIWIHRFDADSLADPAKNLSRAFDFEVRSPKAGRLLEDGEKFKVGSLELEIIHTPGHTPGGICVKCDGVVFTGDTLFCGGVGRTDLPQASEKDLFKSIKTKLLTLDDSVVIYPGHGPSSSIGDEKRNNPFLE